MNLTPTESERLTIFAAAEFARRNLSAGVPLKPPRGGCAHYGRDDVCGPSGHSLRRDHRQGVSAAHQRRRRPGVPSMIPWLSLEGAFPEGTKVLVVFQPIAPSPDDLIPGEVIPGEGEITLNADRPVVELEVLNTGDRDIQVRSHAHFFEVNRALQFDRARAFGLHLDTPSGVGARFEPGITKVVRLVPFGGNRRISGFGGLTNGSIDDPRVRDAAIALARARGYLGA